MKSIRIEVAVFLIPLFCLLLFAGCPSRNNSEIAITQQQNSADITNANTITDSTGVTFTLSAGYSRIISLAPSVTENIKILKSESKLAGRTDFCRVSSEVPSIGTMLEPSIEKIVSLHPDLVLATKEGNHPPIVQRLREMKIPVFVFGESNSWNNIRNDFLILGELLSRTSEAEVIIKNIQMELERITKTNQTLSYLPKKVFVQLGISPLITVGRDTFINEIINYGYGKNIASNSALPWPALSIEEIIKENPQVIIICDMGGITSEAKKIWTEERFAGVEAVKHKKIYIMESDLLCQPTPINFINAVRMIRDYLMQNR